MDSAEAVWPVTSCVFRILSLRRENYFGGEENWECGHYISREVLLQILLIFKRVECFESLSNMFLLYLCVLYTS